MGRKPIGEQAMTAAERQQRSRTSWRRILPPPGMDVAVYPAYCAFLREGKELVKEGRKLETAQRRLENRLASYKRRLERHEARSEFRSYLAPSGD